MVFNVTMLWCVLTIPPEITAAREVAVARMTIQGGILINFLHSGFDEGGSSGWGWWVAWWGLGGERTRGDIY